MAASRVGSTKVGVLALQGAFARHIEILAELGTLATEVRTPEQLAKIDALIMPGGESTTMSMLLESSGLAGPLERRIANGLPVFGTCAGMILLATAVADGRTDQHSYGAIDIGVRRNGFGRQVASFEADLDIVGMAGSAFHAVFIRAPVVEWAAEGVEVLASVDGAPVLVRQGPVLVSSFHPELTDDPRVHQLFIQEVA